MLSTCGGAEVPRPGCSGGSAMLHPGRKGASGTAYRCIGSGVLADYKLSKDGR